MLNWTIGRKQYVGATIIVWAFRFAVHLALMRFLPPTWLVGISAFLAVLCLVLQWVIVAARTKDARPNYTPVWLVSLFFCIPVIGTAGLVFLLFIKRSPNCTIPRLDDSSLLGSVGKLWVVLLANAVLFGSLFLIEQWKYFDDGEWISRANSRYKIMETYRNGFWQRESLESLPGTGPERALVSVTPNVVSEGGEHYGSIVVQNGTDRQIQRVVLHIEIREAGKIIWKQGSDIDLNVPPKMTATARVLLRGFPALTTRQQSSWTTRILVSP